MIFQEQTEQLTQEVQTLKSELALSQARCEQYAQAYDSLKNQIIEMRRHRFGKRSERYIDPENRQLSLFGDENETFAQVDAVGEQTEETTPIAAHTRKRKAKKKTNCLAASKLFLYRMKTSNVLVVHAKQ